MKPAPEFQRITEHLSIWQNYDPTVKADLFSTAILTSAGLNIVDPIPLAEPQLTALLGSRPLRRVIITNANHHRAAEGFVTRFAVTVCSHELAAAPGFALEPLSAGDILDDEIEVVEIPGAGRGEIALFHRAHGGSLVIGDALINFGSHGFDLLPAKYCENPKQMRGSLAKLLGLDFQRMLFAHGTPITTGAKERLAELL